MNIKLKVLKLIEALSSYELSIGATNNNGTRINGKYSGMFLRFGYWKRVETSMIQETLDKYYGNYFEVVEVEWEDDDSGWLYSYRLNIK